MLTMHLHLFTYSQKYNVNKFLFILVYDKNYILSRYYYKVLIKCIKINLGFTKQIYSLHIVLFNLI